MFKSSLTKPEARLGLTLLDGKSVLLVDDDPIFRRITLGYLSSVGCVVHEAEDGLEGLRQLKHVSPDIVICDISMPILDGLEFLEEVSLAYPSLPMIMISATDEMSDVAKALKFGIKDFLSKPISDYANLGAAMVNVLSDTRCPVSDQRDFASQWFQVDGGGELPEEQELYWHLEYLQSNQSAARELLQALMPEHDTAQGIWRCSYRLLQSADTMPLVFDYVWLLNGQYVFYIVDSNSQDCGNVATTLLVRALFHDYLRSLQNRNADLKDLAGILENGIGCMACACPISAILGIADVTGRTLSVLPAGMNCYWKSGIYVHHISAGARLGDNCRKNFITPDLPLGQFTDLTTNSLGVNSFTLTISHKLDEGE
jgi:CheY-like chemotaxis protein